MKAPKYILTISGSDSSGCAGMQADNRAIRLGGGFPLNVLTAVTLQTPDGVEAVEVLEAEFVERQLSALLTKYPVAGIKSGMLGSAAICERVARVLEMYPKIPYILDPVLCSTSGRALLEGEGIAVLRDRLIPRALLTTPNLAELKILTGREFADLNAAFAVGSEWAREIGRAILVKGGHADGANCEDGLLYPDGRRDLFSAKRIETMNTRGTGCALSALIAAYFAIEGDLSRAVALAKERLNASLEAQAESPWTGPGPALL